MRRGKEIDNNSREVLINKGLTGVNNEDLIVNLIIEIVACSALREIKELYENDKSKSGNSVYPVFKKGTER